MNGSHKEPPCSCTDRAGQARCHWHSTLLPSSPAVEVAGKYQQRGIFVGQKTDEKNQKYGDAFNKCGEFLELLYPNGVKPEQYRDMLAVVRIFDKQMRIATDKDALGEDPYADIAGYGLLGMR